VSGVVKSSATEEHRARVLSLHPNDHGERFVWKERDGVRDYREYAGLLFKVEI
jgi:hypothetical protein